MPPRTVPKTCNLCEAMCGLLIEVEDGQIGRIRPDPDDPLSHGAICPKAIGLKELHEDPDRLTAPVRRTAEGFVEISWEEALSETAERLAAIQTRDGDDAVGRYLGNPGAHNFGVIMYLTGLNSALSTQNLYSASSLDQNPKHASCLLLYGNFLFIPVPDVDHTDFFLMLGANPVVSNGSLMTAPGFRKRVKALQERGGKLVVVDPRRTETAALADRYISIEPGKDPWLLATLIHVVLEEKLDRVGPLDPYLDARDALREAIAPFSPDAASVELQMPADELRGLAREFAAAPSAVCYGRVGTCMSPYGTLNSWLIDVLCLLTGNLDRRGGALFPKPAAELSQLAEARGSTGEMRTGETRVRGAVAFNGERPSACLAEEILEPGTGQIRGMLTIAGNPCLSAPNGRALDRAFADLEFYAAVDFYINETTRHADIILPPPVSVEHDNHEVLFHSFAVHNTAKYSPTVVPPRAGQLDDWQILSQLALRIAAIKQGNPIKRAALNLARRFVPGPRRVLDWMLRAGPYGDGFRPWRSGLRLSDLEANPSGIDLGPLAPRLEEHLQKQGRRLNLAPPAMLAELKRLEGDRSPAPRSGSELSLIGRREIRTNNSWFHNLPLSTGGRERFTLQMHPDDAETRNLKDGESVRIWSDTGEVTAPLELTPDLRPGVVSLPHGWGHTGAGLSMQIASAQAGANCNELIPDTRLEPVVGNAIFNGVPVEVRAANPN